MFPLLASASSIDASCVAVEAAPVDDDAALVARALAGDRVAEAQLYRRHARVIANVAARLLGSRADAEDIVQETFVIALENLRGRFNLALGIGAAGFSEGMVCAAPASADSPSPE